MPRSEVELLEQRMLFSVLPITGMGGGGADVIVTVYNADTKQPIMPLSDGVVLNRALLPVHITLVVDTELAARFTDGEFVRADAWGPRTINGERADQTWKAWSPTLGDHAPMFELLRNGTAVETRVIPFTVIDEAPKPVPPPTPAPAKGYGSFILPPGGFVKGVTQYVEFAIGPDFPVDGSVTFQVWDNTNQRIIGGNTDGLDNPLTYDGALLSDVPDGTHEVQALVRNAAGRIVATVKAPLEFTTLIVDPPPQPAPVPVPAPKPQPTPSPAPPAPMPGPSDGWTDIQPAADAIAIYVDAQGSDKNDGLTPATAVKTPGRGFQLLRSGKGDILRLSRGDVFDGGRIWIDKSKVTIASYGDESLPRPVLLAGTEAAIEAANSTSPLRDVKIVGIAVKCYLRDPSDPRFNPDANLNFGFRFNRPFEGLLIEDCKAEGFAQNFAFIPPAGTKINGLVFRRNVSVDAWDRGAAWKNGQLVRDAAGKVVYNRMAKGQCLYVERSPGAIIEENVLDFGGWNETYCPGAKFGHGIYIQGIDPASKTIVRNNIIARAASDAFQLRESGEVYGNLILDCPITGFIAGQSGLFHDNLVIGSGDVANGASGWGFALKSKTGSITNNTFAYKPAGAGEAPVFKLEDQAKAGIVIAGNSLYEWAGEPVKSSVSVSGLNVSGNSWQGGMVRKPAPIDVDAFMAEARQQQRGAWGVEYTARGVINGRYDLLRGSLGKVDGLWIDGVRQ